MEDNTSSAIAAIRARVMDARIARPITPTHWTRGQCKWRGGEGYSFRQLVLTLIAQSEPTCLGGRHAAQIRTCHHCRRYAERCQPFTDSCLRLAWWLVRRLGLGLGWRMGSARRMGSRMASGMGTCVGTWMGMAFRLGMEWTTLHRGAWILWRRMHRPAVGPRPVGTTQDSRQQVLVKRTQAQF
jgi:hypothetical protein